ncbi:SDR family oxidoreductase [Pseudoxanthomonas sp.]|uniref:SDR family NAD(P)-dependent oxidoreductase n=1 Tax=Pseudoxanthomonas sp. TaxID=1871049 RepID=UPI00261E3545|nr:SDR family oxidoreductase [Pseudoxanthomonas sp.]WDS36948.1 MAG: SDR family oxidoreductase [Pseudoxanthomonas sp.]
MNTLIGKKAIVTGGGSGIGRQICLQFAEEGCDALAIYDINEDTANETAQMIAANSKTRCFVYRVDISSFSDVETATAAFVESSGGAPDILVNNVGWDVPAPFLETDPAFWKKIVDINLIGVFNMHSVVLRLMVDNGGGKVINIASDAGRLGAALEAVYSACKGGVITFTKSIAREMARHNILINTVSPGATNTAGYEHVRGLAPDADKFEKALLKLTPMKRLGEPAECARLVTFLASDHASFILGQTISVSGGLTMVG